MFQKIITPSLPLLNKTLAHPFNALLLQQKLPPAVFEVYLSQDLIYLEQLAKLLPKISYRLVSLEDKLIFDNFSRDTVEAEQNMRANFNIKKPKKIFPVIKNYLDHLEYYSSHVDLAVGISAFMPCFWLYKELGGLINAQPIQDKNCKQSRWLNAYINPDFHKATDQAIEIMLNQIDPTREENIIAEMTKIFKTSARYELAFWDECYNYGSNGLAPTA